MFFDLEFCHESCLQFPQEERETVVCEVTEEPRFDKELLPKMSTYTRVVSFDQRTA